MDLEFMKSILEDMEAGIIVWKKYPNSEKYKDKLKNIRKLKKYIKEEERKEKIIWKKQSNK